MQGIIAGLRVQHQTNWAKQTETLGCLGGHALCIHALLILTKWEEVLKIS